jgi:hypothetical protein
MAFKTITSWLSISRLVRLLVRERLRGELGALTSLWDMLSHIFIAGALLAATLMILALALGAMLAAFLMWGGCNA